MGSINPYDPIPKDHRWTVSEAEEISRGVLGTPTAPQELAKAGRLPRSD